MNRCHGSSLLFRGILAIAIVGLGPSIAHAEAPSLSTSLTGDARTSFDAGNILYENGDYAGAATKYRAAYDASHDPRLLWNVATCEKQLRHYARSASLVEQFLHDATPVASPAFIAQAKVTLGALREFYSPITLTVTPAGTHVAIDGEEVGVAPFAGAVPVDLGKHVVRGERAGFESSEVRIEVAGQSPIALAITLKAVPNEASLAISPSGPEDTVSVDEKVVGVGRWQGALAPGKYRVKVTAAGKQPYVAEVDLATSEHRSMDVTLEDEKKRGALPWLIAGGAVLVAGGAVGGYFLFKPSDTEGPAPAGKLGTVFVTSARIGGRH